MYGGWVLSKHPLLLVTNVKIILNLSQVARLMQNILSPSMALTYGTLYPVEMLRLEQKSCLISIIDLPVAEQCGELTGKEWVFEWEA